MNFIDLAAQQERIREKIDRNIQTVLNHGQYIMGPEIKQLEQQLASYVGVKHAIACSSGTDSLLLALMAYDIGPQDAVFTTPFTFFSTAEVISLLGATPIFVDIDPHTFNMDPKSLGQAISALKTGNPSRRYPLPGHDKALSPQGIIAVDLFGLPADYDKINALAEKYGLFVIQDAAQSFGAEYKGKKACSQANIGSTSFFPAKPLGCYGDAGMCFTNDDNLSRKINSLRIHGQGKNKYQNVYVGINGRMDTLQAAILLAKFDIFPEEIELRQQVAVSYCNLIDNISSPVITPVIPNNYISAWAQYSLLTKDQQHRSTLQSKLKEADIPTAVYYPMPLHLQSAFSYLGYKKGDFPVSEDCSRRIFSIPMHPYLQKSDQELISRIIRSGDTRVDEC